jgi:cell wall-associated NlpC family hydrolase
MGATSGGEIVTLSRLLVILACALISAVSCSGRASPVYTTDRSASDADLPVVRRDDLLNEISIYHGVPYRSGGTRITGVDCSGLILAIYGSLGVDLPRTVAEQFAQGRSISRRSVRTGDLVFFGRPPDHAGIAISNTEVIHASPSRGVVIDSLEDLDRSMHTSGYRRVVRLK